MNQRLASLAYGLEKKLPKKDNLKNIFFEDFRILNKEYNENDEQKIIVFDLGEEHLMFLY